GLTTAHDRAALDDPAREAVDRLATRRALRMISRLPANQAEAVMLRVVVGLDVAQTASVLGKRPGAVRVAAMRGLRQLAAAIEQDTSHRDWFAEDDPKRDAERVESGNISTGNSGIDVESDSALSDGAPSGNARSDGAEPDEADPSIDGVAVNAAARGGRRALIGAERATTTGSEEVTERP
ncbi:MAG: sigma factor-like helix-turn-helix DNA-binding protein, partial [Actinocrinis sp.]